MVPTSASLRPDSETEQATGLHFPLISALGPQIDPMKKTHSQDVKGEAKQMQPDAARCSQMPGISRLSNMEAPLHWPRQGQGDISDLQSSMAQETATGLVAVRRAGCYLYAPQPLY